MVAVVTTTTTRKGDDGDKKRERGREKKTSTNVHRRDKIHVLIIPGSIIELNWYNFKNMYYVK